MIAKFDQSSRLGMGPASRAVALHIALTHDIPTFSFDDDDGVVDRVIQAADKDGDLCLDVVDAILRLQPDGMLSRADQTARLADTLTLGGSAWMVAPDSKSLVRRVDSTAVAQFAAATTPVDVASEELREAWNSAYGRNPNPAQAWNHAIKACEALLIPLVCPKKDKANLGSVAGYLKSAPHAWNFTLPDTPNSIGGVQILEQMLRLIWPDPKRHSDGTARPPATQLQAESALQVAVTIVQLVRSNALVKRS